ncbi:MAG: hypothetical protein HKM89_03385 [Gemmatimonadales bacterium]|nr:hypothetical protein [Gemmatimonadales bacterium]
MKAQPLSASDGAASHHTCLLPGGYLDQNDELHREAELVCLSGRHEESLASRPESVPAAVLVTQILSQCVKRIGSVCPVTDDVARRLLVADRQYLLLKLREVTFGDRVEGTLGCPWPTCGAKVDIDFSIADLPVKRCEQVAPTYQVELTPEASPVDADGATHRTITFRLPNGADQESLAPGVADDPARTLTRLLERCIVGTETGCDEGSDLVDRLTARARREIEGAMEATAPRLELEMDLACPECGRAFTAPFELQDFFFGELNTTQDMLYRQVHYLAYHYHWSESEILAMPRDKRLAYIGVLADEIEALNSAV